MAVSVPAAPRSAGINFLALTFPQGDPVFRLECALIDRPPRVCCRTLYLSLPRYCPRSAPWVCSVALGIIRSLPGEVCTEIPADFLPCQVSTASRSSPVSACNPDFNQARLFNGLITASSIFRIAGDRFRDFFSSRCSSGLMPSRISMETILLIKSASPSMAQSGHPLQTAPYVPSCRRQPPHVLRTSEQPIAGWPAGYHLALCPFLRIQQ